MRRTFCAWCLAIALACALQATELQGVISDWSCTQDMVKNGREKTLKQRRNCSLAKDFNRGGYGLITDDKKFYELDEAGNKLARVLLKNTPDKDNLKVVVTGDIEGDTIHVTNMTLV
ncbi:MAG: hypothetical protein WB992_21920 [Bryobacteraceae bacterium]